MPQICFLREVLWRFCEARLCRDPVEAVRRFCVDSEEVLQRLCGNKFGLIFWLFWDRFRNCFRTALDYFRTVFDPIFHFFRCRRHDCIFLHCHCHRLFFYASPPRQIIRPTNFDNNYESAALILQRQRPSATGVKIFRQIFKRPKNRESSSDWQFPDQINRADAIFLSTNFKHMNKRRSLGKLLQKIWKQIRLVTDRKQVNPRRHMVMCTKKWTGKCLPGITHASGACLPGVCQKLTTCLKG